MARSKSVRSGQSPDRAAGDARRAIERAARESHRRLVAFLAARSRDVAAAEDALADAFRAALEAWPRDGVPDKPEAWLLVAARRRLIDASRHARTHAEAVPMLLAAADEAEELAASEIAFPDERLKLLFICAHPAIDAAARTPLMLQIVLGLDAARIASAFLVRPSAMGQRLTRAKAKIRDAGVTFELPASADLPTRVDAVLDAIYAAYGSGWDDIAGADPRRKGLATEAIELGELLVRLLPDDPEAKGLLALMLYCESRRAARRSDDGNYVPLSEQDMTRWSKPIIEEAERLLNSAREAGRVGRFQLEAAIQSAHAARATSGRTDWESIALLYEGLAELAPTTGVLVGRAAAVAEARDAAAGWQLLQEIGEESVKSYQPYWALAAHLLRRTGRTAEAAEAYARAIGLCEDPAMREFLIQQSRN
jgi:RNA polymerase sigma-70 factor (ECF subfamily)